MRKRTEEHIKSHFQKHDKAHPNYVLCIKGEDLGKNNHLKIEVDPYSIETIGAFLNGQSEEERDNRIRHLFKFVNKEYDELAIERITEY